MWTLRQLSVFQNQSDALDQGKWEFKLTFQANTPSNATIFILQNRHKKIQAPLLFIATRIADIWNDSLDNIYCLIKFHI